ncbi:LLM class flavin-dependent oxidoreductase [Rhodococcus opacus]|nr:LLM class flavin-dependent oxidoreductase [Rhodococcus opacus]MDV6244505.1 LLM class flavin-dependent oxidoreductase [Rhodococcus opacus]
MPRGGQRAVRQLATRGAHVRRCRGNHARRRSSAADRPRGHVLHGEGTVEHSAAAAAPSRAIQAGQSAAGVELGARFAEVVFTSLPTLEDAVTYTKSIRARAAELGRADGLPLIMSSFHATYGASEEEVRRLVREQEEATDLDAGRIRLEDMLGGDIDLSGLPLDKPIPADVLPDVRSVNRRRGRVEIFSRLAASGRTLRELIIASKDTGHWAVAGTPEQLADAVQERYEAGVLDVISLGGLAEERTRDFVVNGLLPELRRRGIIGND